MFVQNSLLSDQIASHEELDRIVRVNNGKSIIFRSLFSKVKNRLVEDLSRAAQPTIHLPALVGKSAYHGPMVLTLVVTTLVCTSIDVRDIQIWPLLAELHSDERART